MKVSHNADIIRQANEQTSNPISDPLCKSLTTYCVANQWQTRARAYQRINLFARFVLHTIPQDKLRMMRFVM
jgi:hypothetical protein